MATLGAAVSLAQEFTQAELEKMVTELDAVSKRSTKYLYPIKCSIVNEDQVNAYASVEKFEKGKTPQSVMVVYAGLVKFCKGDRRIIRAVVAHEVSHLMLSHVNPSQLVATDLRHLMTRQEEMAADAQGAILLQKAGYDKKDMVDMLLKLDEMEKDSGWMWKLSKNDHTSAKNRASEVMGNPNVMRASLAFDKGLAYWECRLYGTAAALFDKAYKQDPNLTEALINGAQVALMNYYDKLPISVQNLWYRPDFGPMLAPPAVSRGEAISDEDIARFKDAMAHIQTAKTKLPGNARVAEMEALAGVLDPAGTKESFTAAAQKLETMIASGSERDKLRFANNAALGYKRAENTQKAYDILIGAQKKTTVFNPFLGQNLGRFSVENRSKDDESLVASVMLTWLNNVPTTNPYYEIVKETYKKSCEKLGIKQEELKPRPAYLCTAAALCVNGKEAGLLTDAADFVDAFGAPAAQLKIDDKYPDVQFWVWSGSVLSALTERGQIVRVTTEAPGAYLDLKASDPTVTKSYRISVGMTQEDFEKVLDLSKSTVQKVVGNTGKLEDWNFYPGLQFGVHVVDGKVTGITVAPTAKNDD